MNVRNPDVFISREEAAARIARVLKAFRNLSLSGFDFVGGMHHIDFNTDRDLMLDDWRISQFQKATLYLSTRCYHIDKVRRYTSSHTFKLRAERSLRDMGVSNPYISNGILIAAAISLGYKARPIPGSPNANMNMAVVRGDIAGPPPR